MNGLSIYNRVIKCNLWSVKNMYILWENKANIYSTKTLYVALALKRRKREFFKLCRFCTLWGGRVYTENKITLCLQNSKHFSPGCLRWNVGSSGMSKACFGMMNERVLAPTITTFLGNSISREENVQHLSFEHEKGAVHVLADR